jgi:hypothetical protein
LVRDFKEPVIGSFFVAKKCQYAVVVPQFSEMFQTCHAERRASPGEAGISASRSIPRICPLPCNVKEFSSMQFALKAVAAANGVVLGRTPWGSMVKETFSGWIRLALALPHRGIVRASFTMTGKKL